MVKQVKNTVKVERMTNMLGRALVAFSEMEDVQKSINEQNLLLPSRLFTEERG